jgi:hypothetical protein
MWLHLLHLSCYHLGTIVERLTEPLLGGPKCDQVSLSFVYITYVENDARGSKATNLP